jgi:hypothetical protein
MERRAFLLSSMMLALTAGRGEASPIDPAQTFVLQRDQIKFGPWDGLPPGSGEMAKLYGDLDKPGPLSRPDEMESGLVQRAAQLRYRSHPDCIVGDVVGEQRRRFRSQERRAGCRWRVRQTYRADLPLRRRSEWRPGARRRCSLWRRARRHRTLGSASALMAPRLKTRAAPSSSTRVPRRRV